MDNRDIDWLLAPESERNGSYLTEQNAQATIANNNGNAILDRNILANISKYALMAAKGLRAATLSIFCCINCYNIEWQ